jgi:predicted dinucleotide-binding enzyme
VSTSIGVLGSGQVGQVLARGLLAKGHRVRLATRAPDKLDEFRRSTGIELGTTAEVAAWGGTVILAVKGSAAEACVAALPAAVLSGKTVIDTTNPIAEAPPEGGLLRLFTGANDSLMERLQRAHPGAHFVKAWNSVGSAFMIDPRFAGGPPTMFIGGDSAAAKAEVTQLLAECGWDTEDVGGVQAARALEPLCQLWCAPGFLRGQWGHAFKLLRS